MWKHRPKDFTPGSEADPTPKQLYDGLMKGTFAPALRAAGLKGSGGRFELPSEKYWAQLGFQKSAYSDSAALQFTVNLSVISRQVWAEQAAARPHLGGKPTPNIGYGSWADQVRIGDLTDRSLAATPVRRWSSARFSQFDFGSGSVVVPRGRAFWGIRRFNQLISISFLSGPSLRRYPLVRGRETDSGLTRAARGERALAPVAANNVTDRESSVLSSDTQ